MSDRLKGTKYVQKGRTPVEAIKFTGGNLADIAKFFGDAVWDEEMLRKGDYIVRYASGEYVGMTTDTFLDKYERM